MSRTARATDLEAKPSNAFGVPGAIQRKPFGGRRLCVGRFVTGARSWERVFEFEHPHAEARKRRRSGADAQPP